MTREEERRNQQARLWDRRDVLRAGCALAAAQALGAAAEGEIRNRVSTMKYRPLGRTGLMLSEIGLGAHYHAPGWEQKGAKLPGRRKQVVAKALELGINFFDNCIDEERETLGESLEPYQSRVFTMADVNALVGRRQGTAQDFRAEFLRNLKVLCMDSVELYRFNNNNQKDDITFKLTEEAYRAFERLRGEGKARHFAVSGHDPAQMLSCIQRYSFIEAFYLPFNYVTQGAAAELFPAAKQKGVGVIVIKPFMFGAFFKLPADDPTLAGMAHRRNESLAQANLRFVLANDAVTTVIPGMQTVEEVTANVRALDRDAPERADLELLESAREHACSNLPPGYRWLVDRWSLRA